MNLSYETEDLRDIAENPSINGSFALASQELLDDFRAVIADLIAADNLQDAPLEFKKVKSDDKLILIRLSNFVYLEFEVLGKRRSIFNNSISRLKLTHIYDSKLNTLPDIEVA